ncbi:hypothetical protein Tco_0735901 [Tanacetum coccineum]
MSTSNTHQQSLADADCETRPLMLERGNYIPWESRFRRYHNQKRENKKWLNKAIDEGPYEFRIFTPSETEAPRETLFNNEFDHFVAEPGEALVSVYNHFAHLMNDLERNDIIFPNVTVNTKFLNCLQPEWLKYVTQVRLAKRLTEDSYDDLFDYLQQFEKLVNASRAKKVEKSHDPLALVAHTGSSSRTTTPYYVTHPPSVVDYDDDYQGDAVQNNSEDPLTPAMILLARAITQRFSNPTNNHLRTSSNTRNQATVQGDRLNIQSKNYGNGGRNIRRSYFQEEIIEGNNVQNDAGNIQRTPNYVFRIQPIHFATDEGPSYDSAFLSKVETSSTSYVNPLFTKDTHEQNVSVEYDKNVQESYALEQLARNVYKEAEKQQIFAQNVQQQNIVLTKQLESYKEKVRVFEMTKGNNTTDFNEYIEVDRKAKRFEQESQSQFIHDRDVIRDLEQQCDKLELSIVELKRQIVALQKTQSILKRKMSENEDKYHDILLDLEARA